MPYWIVRARWQEKERKAERRRGFPDQDKARAFMAGGDPYGDLHCPGANPHLVQANAVTWELTRCNPEAQPWVFRPAPALHRGINERDWHLRQQAALKAIRNHFVDRCERVLAFDWDQNRVEGPLDPVLRSRLQRGNWFGMQLYLGERTLYHLDDGSDVWFVVGPGDLQRLLALGVELDLIEPDFPGDSLERITDPRWTGG